MNRNLLQLNATLHQLRPAAMNGAQANLQISQWNVSQHLTHLILVNTSLAERICADSTGDSPVLPTKLVTHVVMLTKYIPRGRGRSPSELVPELVVDPQIADKWAAHSADMQTRAPAIETALRRPGRFNHPVFGGLNRKQWLRFMLIHTIHHQKIIADISHYPATKA